MKNSHIVAVSESINWYIPCWKKLKIIIYKGYQQNIYNLRATCTDQLQKVQSIIMKIKPADQVSVSEICYLSTIHSIFGFWEKVAAEMCNLSDNSL